MKKILILFAALFLIAGIVMAEDIGLTAGLEFGAYNVTGANDWDMSPYLMPMIIYENSFLDDALDVYTELDYTFGFNKVGDDFPMDLYWDLALGYNIFFGSDSTLSILAENELDFFLAPTDSDANNMDGVFTPGLSFNQGLDFGSINFTALLPINYLQDEKDADIGIGLNFTLGWKSNFGLGIKLRERNFVAPEFEYRDIRLTVSYATDPIYAELAATFPKEIDISGITIRPAFEYYFNAFTFYINCSFEGIGTDGDIEISPALGAKFSF